LALSQIFDLEPHFQYYSQIKDLADFANKHKPFGKHWLAMFYTHCCVQAFFIRKASVRMKSVGNVPFWLVYFFLIRNDSVRIKSVGNVP